MCNPPSILKSAKLECWTVMVQYLGGSERIFCSVSSEIQARELVDRLNRNPRNTAWCEQRELIGSKTNQ